MDIAARTVRDIDIYTCMIQIMNGHIYIYIYNVREMCLDMYCCGKTNIGSQAANKQPTRGLCNDAVHRSIQDSSARKCMHNFRGARRIYLWSRQLFLWGLVHGQRCKTIYIYIYIYIIIHIYIYICIYSYIFNDIYNLVGVHIHTYIYIYIYI